MVLTYIHPVFFSIDFPEPSAYEKIPCDFRAYNRSRLYLNKKQRCTLRISYRLITGLAISRNRQSSFCYSHLTSHCHSFPFNVQVLQWYNYKYIRRIQNIKHQF